jgi:uncharacterized Zn-binding protein involved in type VI secretion
MIRKPGATPRFKPLPGRPGVTYLPPPGKTKFDLPDASVPSNPQGKAAGRLADQSSVGSDAHGCPACPHPGVGPAIQGSPDVFINRRNALREDDMGIHAACCGPNTWYAAGGSNSVFINDRRAHRKGDPDDHCGGSGQLIQGSHDVFFG